MLKMAPAFFLSLIHILADKAEQVVRRNAAADERTVGVVADFVGHNAHLGDADVLCKGLDALVGLHASCAGLDDDDELDVYKRQA